MPHSLRQRAGLPGFQVPAGPGDSACKDGGVTFNAAPFILGRHSNPNERRRNRRSRFPARRSSPSTPRLPIAFLAAFGNKETTLKRLLKAATPTSPICPAASSSATTSTSRSARRARSPPPSRRCAQAPQPPQPKAKFILATDGQTLEAENLADDDPPLVCAYNDFRRPFRLLPAAGRHHDRQADPRERLRHQGHRPAQQALHRAAAGQPRLGHRRPPPGPEPLHGPADLLLLRRGHQHLPGNQPVHRHRRPDERARLLEYARGALRAVPRHEHPLARPRRRRTSARLGRRLPLRQRRPVLRQHRTLPRFSRSPAPTCFTSATSTGRRSIPTSSAP